MKMKKIIGAISFLVLISTIYMVYPTDNTEKDMGDKFNSNVNYEPYEYTEEDYEIVKTQESAESVEIFGNILFYENLDELEKDTQIILVGSPKKHLVERETKYSTYLNQFDDPIRYQYYHVLNLDIKKVIKGEELLNDNTILGQAGGFDIDKNYISKYDGTSFTNKGAEYIYYFIESPKIPNQYFIASVYQGKINIDGRDKEEALGIMNNDVKDKIFEGEKVSKLSEIAEEKMTLGEQIKVGALKKYEKEIKSLGIPIVVDVEVTKNDLVKYDSDFKEHTEEDIWENEK